MSVLGIGTDIIEIRRIEKSAKKSGTFLQRCFTEDENKLIAERISNNKTIAVNFAAKEAYVKALGIGFCGIAPNEIEILRDERGKPYINVYGAAFKEAEKLGVLKTHVSLTHSDEYAQAFVILEG